MPHRARVLLGELAVRVRASLVELTGRQADMEIVGRTDDAVELLLLAGERRADVVVLGVASAGQDPGICSHLLAEYPHLVIIAVPPEPVETAAYRYVVSREPLVAATDETILAVIRRVTLGGA